MMRYLKLVNFEFNRIAKVYVVLLGIVLTSQMIAVITASRNYLKDANESLNVEMMSQADFLSTYGHMTFHNVVRSLWFGGPIALCIAAVAFYIFFIWYRDWFGKNTFAYRLLTLPTSRLNVLYAKLTTILMMTFGFIAFQFIIYQVEARVMQWMVPKDFRMDMSFHEVVRSMLDLGILFPEEPLAFLFTYGAGVVVVVTLFTGILFERSFRWKGIIGAVAYGFIAGLVFFLPLILHETVMQQFFYPTELVLLTVLAGVIVLAGSLAMSGYLLNKKIRI
ncbi:hypothetical protein JNUCC1_02193 [Lentibacillus sp. JNUCC-1]|uniref:hypothetical protein n=1 Tax=Lentibacillus sp. JNUCC-1 TaxID=2654513 RepID=UPI0012E94B96|nr:hypothetical protein [Lentibacillus sp. JNUCC-1]MUV38355.1 hypothetical protein [Lentibacillus sp. JNUCC-1]